MHPGFADFPTLSQPVGQIRGSVGVDGVHASVGANRIGQLPARKATEQVGARFPKAKLGVGIVHRAEHPNRLESRFGNVLVQ